MNTELKQSSYLHMETSRLVIRQWQSTDYEPFSQMNQDPEVMQYFPKLLTPAESHAMIEKSITGLEQDKVGFWAVQSKDIGEFLGFVALAKVQFDCKFKGSIEIGWRLKKTAWGKGFASEGARKLLEYGFLTLGLPEIVSLTAKVNQRSWRVMERIGMRTNEADDFEHPKVALDSHLRPHVLYRLSKNEWAAKKREWQD